MPTNYQIRQKLDKMHHCAGTGRQEATYRVTRRSTNEESSLFQRVYYVIEKRVS